MSQPDEYERCSVCGRIAEDVTFDYLGPDPNNPWSGEKWDYICGPDQGCSSPEALEAASLGVEQP